MTAKPGLFFLLVIFAGGTACAQQPGFDSTGLINGGEAVRLVARQFGFTEGPAVDKAGNIFFTDQPNDQVWEYDTAGRLSVFLHPSRRANGLYFNPEGKLVMAADLVDELCSVDTNRTFQYLMPGYRGPRLNGPNDLWINAQGDIWFTDPYYKRPWWGGLHPAAAREWTYLLGKGMKNPVVADATLSQPNGIVGTPDGRFLFVADIRGDKTYRFRIGPAGQLTEKTLFVPQGSDGMTLDDRGNLYLAANGITVYDPEGKKIAFIPVPEKWTANLCFGGKDKNVLFITASEGIYVLPMRVKGVE